MLMAIFTAAFAPDDADKKVRYALTGTWKVTRNNNGKVVSETDNRLDFGQKSKWMDCTDLSGKVKDQTFPAIYKLDKETMKFCFRSNVEKWQACREARRRRHRANTDAPQAGEALSRAKTDRPQLEWNQLDGTTTSLTLSNDLCDV